MTLIERFQNPKVNDTVTLRMLVYNNHQFSDVNSVDKVEIWKIDDLNPNDFDKRTLVQTIDGTNVSHDGDGQYSVEVYLEEPLYVIGKYVDIWHMAFATHDQNACQIAKIDAIFEIVRDLWFTTPSPIIYDFSFAFKPNKFVQGCKQYIVINITPNVPTATEMQEYYANMATVSPLRISIAQRCGDCVPVEEDLRLIVDNELITYRERCLAYYFLDTTEMDKGIFDVFFTLELGENLYISPRSQFQIY
jgi:hypothetical protein